MRSGFGVLKYEDGRMYQGYWSEDMKEGQGKLTDKFGSVIKQGEWKNDEN